MRILLGLCLISWTVAGSALADNGSNPDEERLYRSIKETAASLLKTDAIEKLAEPKVRIKRLFDELVEAYGVKNRLVAAQVLAELLPEEHRLLIARRALFYSPVKADELMRRLGAQGRRMGVSHSVLSALPGGNVHTTTVAAAAGSQVQLPERAFRLPQVELRRRAASTTDGDGRVTAASGQYDPDGDGQLPAVPATATLIPFDENGFLDGMAYVLVESETGDLIGVYGAIKVVSGSVFEFYWKFGTSGSGDDFMVTITDI